MRLRSRARRGQGPGTHSGWDSPPLHADLDLALATIPYFLGLSPDERSRLAGLARTVELPKASAHELLPDGAAVLVTLSGEVTVAREGAGSLRLEAGDWTDDLRAIVCRGRGGR